MDHVHASSSSDAEIVEGWLMARALQNEKHRRHFSCKGSKRIMPTLMNNGQGLRKSSLL